MLFRSGGRAHGRGHAGGAGGDQPWLLCLSAVSLQSVHAAGPTGRNGRGAEPAAARPRPRLSSADALHRLCRAFGGLFLCDRRDGATRGGACLRARDRSEEHTTELQSLMSITYAVICLKNIKKNHNTAN